MYIKFYFYLHHHTLSEAHQKNLIFARDKNILRVTSKEIDLVYMVLKD